MFALFKDGKMISKPYPTQEQATMEAVERGLVVSMPIITRTILADGVTIGDLSPKEKP